MEYIKNLKPTEFGIEGEVFFSLFDEYIGIIIEEDSNEEFAGKCAKLLNGLSEPIIDHLCRASELYCNDFLDAIGEPQVQFEANRSVLSKVYPGGLIVPEPNSTQTPVVRMELNCEWEEEHGMEWVIRDDRVYYVGAYTGCDPYDDFESKDGWNFAWQVD